MENKVLLILIDGLRPDALAQCQHPFLYSFMKDSSAHTFHGQSVMPSITLWSRPSRLRPASRTTSRRRAAI